MSALEDARAAAVSAQRVVADLESGSEQPAPTIVGITVDFSDGTSVQVPVGNEPTPTGNAGEVASTAPPVVPGTQPEGA